MALRLESVGEKSDVIVHEYGWKDAALYALAVGAKRDAELDFSFEERGPKVLPTFAVIPAFAAAEALFDVVGGDLLGVVHGRQSVTLHESFAPSGKLRTVGTVAGVYDFKRFAQAVFTTETRDENEKLIAETSWEVIFRLDGGFGGPRPPAGERVKVPKRSPDFEVVEKTTEEQALLYRLTGDLNPLHADPEVSEKVGFGKPILHGLCTYGFIGRAVVQQACGGDPSRLKQLNAQFRKPVWPGDSLVTQGWHEEGRVVLRLGTLERPDEVAVSNAFALID